MFLNAILFNSEAWHDVRNSDINRLEKVDEALLRVILGSHSKSPIEMLYLETSTMPLRFIIGSRRLMYLQTLLKRNNDELTKQVLLAQKRNPTKGDFILLCQDDLKTMKIDANFGMIENLSKQAFKRMVKIKVRNAALSFLLSLKEQHSKVRHIEYKGLEAQNYLKSIIFTNDEASLLFGLRTKTARQFKGNFPFQNTICIHCPLKCWKTKETPLIDSQEHILQCKSLSDIRSQDIANDKVEYSNLFSHVKKQKETVTLIKLLLEERDKLCPPGAKLDPSTVTDLCCGSNTTNLLL